MNPSRKYGSLLLLVIVSVAWPFGSTTAQDWPQWRGPNRDGVWNESGIVDKFSADQLPLKWRTEIGAGYSGPTVANGLVYVMDRITDPSQIERVLCLDAETGEIVWTHQYDCKYVDVGFPAGPRASVTIDDDRAYAFGTMGHLNCLNAKTGDKIWSRDINSDYNIQVLKDRVNNRMPVWGMTCSPLVYEDLVIMQIGAKEAGVVALNKTTGKEVWRSLDDPGQYSSPIVIRQAEKDVVVCWTGSSVSGLAPLTGEVYWRHEFPASKMPIGCATPVVVDDMLFVTSFYDGSLMLRINPDRLAVDEVWQRTGASELKTEALHSMISTPVLLDNHVYGVDSYGEMRCLDASNGERLWEDLSAVPKARWSNIHFVQKDDRIWMFNERGELLIGTLSPSGFQEISRTKLIEPTRQQLRQRGGVCWSHPAFAMKSVFARNDREIVCADLSDK